MPNSNITPVANLINHDELLRLLMDSRDTITGKVEQINHLEALSNATKAYQQQHAHDTDTIKYLHSIDDILKMTFTTDSRQIIERIDLMRDRLQTHKPAQLASEPTNAHSKHPNPHKDDLETLSGHIDSISAVYDTLIAMNVVLPLIANAKDLSMVKSLASQMQLNCEQAEDTLEQYLNQLQADYLNQRQSHHKDDLEAMSGDIAPVVPAKGGNA